MFKINQTSSDISGYLLNMLFKMQVRINDYAQIFKVVNNCDHLSFDEDVRLLLLLEKYIPTVLLTLRVRQLLVSQSETLFSTAVSFDAACSLFLACVQMTVSSAYIWIWTSGQIRGRSLIYKLNKIGPKIDPCWTPMVLFAKEEHA